MRVNGSVPCEVGTHQRLFELESINGAAVVWTRVIEQNGQFRNQGSREKIKSISYSDLLGLTVSFVPFPKKSLSDRSGHPVMVSQLPASDAIVAGSVEGTVLQFLFRGKCQAPLCH